jgi:hypothetical protein
MKKFISFFLSLAFAGSTFAQMSGYSSSQSDGTTLGANETLTADGIALGNAVKLRGYVDFVFEYLDWENDYQGEDFKTSTDFDLLFDLSPVTAELHLTADPDDIGLEQAFGRYSVNQDLHFTFGRQLTVLGFESDEAPGLYAVSYGHLLSSRIIGDKLLNEDQNLFSGIRRNYVDGIRANYNNGMFGLTFGLHDGYWLGNDFDGDNLAIDLAASVMFFPGLEARLGYAHQSLDIDLLKEVGQAFQTVYVPSSDGDIDQFNAWLAYNPGALTLATEFDTYNLDLSTGSDIDYWSWMLLANYQFTDWFAGTLRYTHEDIDLGSGITYDSDRISFAVLFSLTDHFGINVEYSTTSVDSSSNAVSAIGQSGDLDEFYVEGLITY